MSEFRIGSTFWAIESGTLVKEDKMRGWLKPALWTCVIGFAGCGAATSPTPATLTENSAPLKPAPDSSLGSDTEPLLPVPQLPMDPLPAVENVNSQAKAAFDQLVAAAEDGNPEAWTAADETLRGLGAEIVPVLIPALAGNHPLAREMAVMFLAQLGPEAAPAAGALELVLDDPSPFVRVNAAALLTTLDDPPAEAGRTLVTLVAHPDSSLKITAINALANLVNADSPVVTAIAACLDDADANVRQAAASTLGRLGTPAAGALPRIRPLLDDPDPSVKDAALFAIRLLDPATNAGDSTTRTTSAQQSVPALDP